MSVYEKNLSMPSLGPAVEAVLRLLGDGTRQAGVLFELWRERRRTRSALGRLDERMLRDIGVDRATAAHEADKLFWKP